MASDVQRAEMLGFKGCKFGTAVAAVALYVASEVSVAIALLI
jgi:hypothetical protein